MKKPFVSEHHAPVPTYQQWSFDLSDEIFEAVKELARVTRSGGVLVFTVRDDYWQSTNFIDLVTELHVSGVAGIEQIRLEPYIHSEGSECRFVVLRVC